MRASRSLLVAAIALFLIGCTAHTPQPSSGTLGETGLVEGLPVGWWGSSTDPGHYSAFSDRTISHGGQTSLRVTSNGLCIDEFMSVHQGVEAQEFAGKQVRFKAFLRTSDAKSVGLWVRADSETHRAIAFYNMHDRRIKGTTGWRQYSIALDIPEEAVAVFFGLVMEESGEAWMDDCSLKVTNLKIRPNEKSSPGYEGFKISDRIFMYPANMDFEAGENMIGIPQ